LPPDNLKIESLFSDLRRHQRRISGRNSTAELRDFGQYRVLFIAENEEQLLAQIREVRVVEYNAQRHRLALAEAPRQQKLRLHRNPVSTIQALVNQHQEILTVLESQTLKY
jgi:CO/xanthine dehydrogenase Mo-binding subunit